MLIEIEYVVSRLCTRYSSLDTEDAAQREERVATLLASAMLGAQAIALLADGIITTLALEKVLSDRHLIQSVATNALQNFVPVLAHLQSLLAFIRVVDLRLCLLALRAYFGRSSVDVLGELVAVLA